MVKLAVSLPPGTPMGFQLLAFVKFPDAAAFVHAMSAARAWDDTSQTVINTTTAVNDFVSTLPALPWSPAIQLLPQRDGTPPDQNFFLQLLPNSLL